MKGSVRRAALAAVVAAGALAGIPGPAAQAGHQSGPYFDLGALKPPDLTG